MARPVNRERGKSAFDAASFGGVDIPTDISFTIASGSTNEVDVTISLVNTDGTAIDHIQGLDIYVSGDSGGAGIASASGTLSVTSGFSLGAYTSDKSIAGMSDSSGQFTVKVTDSSTNEIYVCAVPKSTGKVAVSRLIEAGDYGT